ncbi:uncharacterized protein LOC128642208 [Bombina bombina]|uniref:uncharacterized protein LOC128642208 n=1 Tax=Bombina bombina TaxID=8345 RepID=UPI00235AAB7E|nr:uncharacterized protein LOC128642208 [Bombina bombina]
MLVGIFSREGDSCYDWLVQQLLSPMFKPLVTDVRCVYISNTGSQNFYNEVSKCAFAILYHSKKRGRINVTDVVDSLYDEELMHLSRALGKDRVVVVIDDLEDSTLAEKNRILSEQRSIAALATDLFLISESEKSSIQLTGSPWAESLYQNGRTMSVREKLETLKQIIGRGQRRRSKIWIIFVCLAIVVIVVIIIVSVNQKQLHSPDIIGPIVNTSREEIKISTSRNDLKIT